MHQKRIVITGANGFTGQHFTRFARSFGHEIIPLRSELTKAKELTAELANTEYDFVVHLAAISAITHSVESAFYDVNLFGTLNLLNAISCGQSIPQKVIIASSANIYGNSTLSPIPETAPATPVNHYAMSKFSMELMTAAQFSDLPIVVVRPFNYTGRGHDERFVIPKIVDHFKTQSTTIELGNMEVEREFNDVRTVCNIYLKLLDLAISGNAYNVCSGRTHTLQHILATLSALTGHKIKATVNPAFVRAQEVQTLCGSPEKLEACIGKVNHPPIEDTLSWMLENQ